MRKAAVLTGTAMLGAGALLFLYALYLTSAGSVVGGVGRVAVLLLVAGAVAVTAGGLTVATRGYADRSWVLYGAAVLLHLAWYALTLAIGESA